MALIKLDFDNFIELKNQLHLSLFYTEDSAGFGIFMFLEGQTFGTFLTLDELRSRFGASDKVLTIFRATYLGNARKILAVDNGAGIVAFNDFKIDVSELRSTLGDFLDQFRKITITTTGGEGTHGYALIPTRLGSGKMRRCMSCGNIILSNEDRCPACGSSELTDKDAEMNLQKFVGWDFSLTLPWILKFLEKYTMSQITDITHDQKKLIKEVLMKSLMEGWTLNKLENDIQNVIGDEDRARMIARTEVIRASNEGALLHYEENDIEKVKWIAVPGSPGGRTCDRCIERNGREYLLKDARGQIPLHPACRCCWSAIITKA